MASPLDHIAILRCPVTFQSLLSVSSDDLNNYNRLIENRTLTRRDLSEVTHPLQAALINESCTLIYEIREDIALLLPSAAIAIPTTEDAVISDFGMLMDDVRKTAVKTFYDEKGWQKEDSEYGDAKLFIDRRPAVTRYQKKCSKRIANALGKGGRYLLDAASGPIPHGPETEYALPYDFHVCLDISITALKEAKRNLGDRGLYLLGDVTNLPIMDDSIDGAGSLHTIYHVPKDEQRNAFLELHRVLKPGGTAAVAYNWGRHAVAINLMTLPIQLYRFLQKRIPFMRTKQTQGMNKLYFHAHSYQWFTSHTWPFEYRIIPLQLVNKAFFTLYVHDKLGGDWILDRVHRLEERHPDRLAVSCYYPLIAFTKRQETTELSDNADS